MEIRSTVILRNDYVETGKRDVRRNNFPESERTLMTYLTHTVLDRGIKPLTDFVIQLVWLATYPALGRREYRGLTLAHNIQMARTLSYPPLRQNASLSDNSKHIIKTLFMINDGM